MKDENDLVERTTEFALRVLRMFVSLPMVRLGSLGGGCSIRFPHTRGDGPMG